MSVVKPVIPFLSSTDRKGLVQFCMVMHTGTFFGLFVYLAIRTFFYLAALTFMQIPKLHCSSLTIMTICMHVLVCTCK